jgi:hypothetical protein
MRWLNEISCMITINGNLEVLLRGISRQEDGTNFVSSLGYAGVSKRRI